MKKIIIIIFTILTSILLASCNSNSVRLFIPGEYLSTDLISKFQEKYNKKLSITTFISNEAAVTKLKSGEKFDVIVPSDYAIEQLYQENRLQKLDWSKIKFEGYDSILNRQTAFSSSIKQAFDKFRDQSKFDFLDYAMPYFWGNVGLIYNTDKVNIDEIKKLEWNILGRNDKYKIAMYDSSRDGFMIAMKALGYSSNTYDVNKLNKAKDLLNKFTSNAKYDKIGKDSIAKYRTTFITDEIFDDMEHGLHDIAVAYSGDAVEIMYRLTESVKNTNLAYYVPEKMGSNIWIDGIVIPEGAKLDNSYDFINFIIEYNNAAINSDDISYSSPIDIIYNEQLEYYKNFDPKLDDYKDDYSFLLNDEKRLKHVSNTMKNIYETLNVKINKNDEVYKYILKIKQYTERQWDIFRAR